MLQTNSTDTMVHVIDPATNAVVGEIGGIPVAHGVAAAPDGSRIYVSGEAETALKVVDAHTLKVIKTIPLSARPNNISITPDGKKVYVGIIAAPGAIDVIDTVTLEKIKTIAVPGGIHDVYVTPDGKNVIAGSIAGRRLTVLDTSTDTDAWAWEGEAIRPATMSTKADGSTDKVFIQVSGHHGFVVLDWDSRKEVARITQPDVPPAERYDSTYNGAPAHGIGVAPDGKTLRVDEPDEQPRVRVLRTGPEAGGRRSDRHGPGPDRVHPGQQACRRGQRRIEHRLGHRHGERCRR